MIPHFHILPMNVLKHKDMRNESIDIAVIGGGAAGYFGAINIAESNRTLKVVLFEGSHKPLAKVKVSGGGRCNVTHHLFEPVELVKRYPRGKKELRGPLTIFGPTETIAWFADHGVQLKVERDGRMFPTTDKSTTIIQCLTDAAQKGGVRLMLGTKVTVAKQVENGFQLTTNQDEILHCKKLLIATGSSRPGYALAQSFSHTIEKLVPSLFTFKIKDERLTDLPGVAFGDVGLTLMVEKKKFIASGPLLITHWGLSGPGIIRQSAWAAKALYETNYQGTLKVNFLPRFTRETLQTELIKIKETRGKQKLMVSLFGEIPKRYWHRICELEGLSIDMQLATVTNKELNKIAVALTEARFWVNGKGQFKEEFVTCGGVKLKEIDFKTMESKIVPGLYFAGEVINIDGITGGFNFQNAWTTSYLAAQHMAL